jgi:PAS domain S-box-containing protein
MPEIPLMAIAGFRAEAYRAGKTIFTNKIVQSGIDYLPGGKASAANMILAPLPVQGKVVGLLGFIDKPAGFTAEDAGIATGFGEIAALALAKSRNLESLENSEVRFRSLIETATDAIVSVNGEGRITHWNKGAEKLFGYTAEEIGGREITLIVPSGMHEAHTVGFARALASGRLQNPGVSRELSGRKKDGVEVPVELTVSQWQTREGIFFTSIIRDISERKRDEQARMKLQAQLNQAQKMEAIGVLAGGIAHDFNNILGAIIGYTEMAKDDADDRSPLADDLDKVLIAAHRAKDLVKQILGFSRQSTVKRIPIKILPLIKESLKMLRASIPTTITIKHNLQVAGRAVLADPTQIHQIIMNLCSNAAHAMEHGGGMMTVTAKTVSLDQPKPFDSCELLPGEYVELAVSDTGTGIGPEVLEKIFDPYFTTKEVGKGTGMGLSIIHGIVKSYGGAITVDSMFGLGATFRVYFPVVQEEEKKEEIAPKAPLGKERILFLDDEEVLTRMGKVLLERLGYTVTVYNDSLEALAAFMRDPDQFDLVITDQTMPGMTGTDLSRRLLQLRPALRIILCTGYSNLVNEESAKLLGIKGFALKPLSKNMIGQLIHQVLNESPVQ